MEKDDNFYSSVLILELECLASGRPKKRASHHPSALLHRMLSPPSKAVQAWLGTILLTQLAGDSALLFFFVH